MTQTPARPITLYWDTLSGHCHRIRLFLSILKIPYDINHIVIRDGQHKQPGYLRLDPFGQLPAIDDDGMFLADSNAILVYLALRYDAARQWLPADAVTSAEIQRWLSVAAGPLANGPASARLVTVFGAPLDHPRTIQIAENLFTVMDAHLDGRQFLVGAQPTIADIACYSYIAHAPEGGVSLAPFANLRGWLARIEQLPGFIAMQATQAGLLAA